VFAHLIAFVGLSAVVIVTPGPDTALTIRNALRFGRRGGLQTALGVATCQATWALCTAGGVAAVLRASQPVFLAVRGVGLAYLVYLGFQDGTSGVSDVAPDTPLDPVRSCTC
jgi:threonine/homoserine/homoserine lactone efflux protein